MPDDRSPEEKEQERQARVELGRLARRVPSQEELTAMKKPDLQGYVVLGRRKQGGNTFELGPVEHSFSLGTSSERTQFDWSSDNATSNFGGSFKIDGLERAKRDVERLEKSKPDYEWFIFDIHDPDIPVLIDWDEWRAAGAPGWTLSGVIDKFRRRNVRFFMKES